MTVSYRTTRNLKPTVRTWKWMLGIPFLLRMAYLQGQTVSFREGSTCFLQVFRCVDPPIEGQEAWLRPIAVELMWNESKLDGDLQSKTQNILRSEVDDLKRSVPLTFCTPIMFISYPSKIQSTAHILNRLEIVQFTCGQPRVPTLSTSWVLERGHEKQSPWGRVAIVEFVCARPSAWQYTFWCLLYYCMYWLYLY